MTKECKKYTPDNQPIEDFIDREQAALIRYLEMAYEQKKITETYYQFGLGQHCDSDDWDGASEYFKSALAEFIDQHERYEYFHLLERAEKGETYIASLEPNSVMHRKGVALYEQICRELRSYTSNKRSDGHGTRSA